MGPLGMVAFGAIDIMKCIAVNACMLLCGVPSPVFVNTRGSKRVADPSLLLYTVPPTLLPHILSAGLATTTAPPFESACILCLCLGIVVISRDTVAFPPTVPKGFPTLVPRGVLSLKSGRFVPNAVFVPNSAAKALPIKLPSRIAHSVEGTTELVYPTITPWGMSPNANKHKKLKKQTSRAKDSGNIDYS